MEAFTYTLPMLCMGFKKLFYLCNTPNVTLYPLNEVNYILPVESIYCEDFTIGETVEGACPVSEQSLSSESSASFVICKQHQRHFVRIYV